MKSDEPLFRLLTVSAIALVFVAAAAIIVYACRDSADRFTPAAIQQQADRERSRPAG